MCLHDNEQRKGITIKTSATFVCVHDYNYVSARQIISDDGVPYDATHTHTRSHALVRIVVALTVVYAVNVCCMHVSIKKLYLFI